MICLDIIYIINETGGNKLKTKENMKTVLMIAIIYINFSLWFLEYSEIVHIVLTIGIIILYQLFSEKKVKIHKSGLYFVLFMLFLILISCFFNVDFGKLNISVIIKWIIALFLISTFTFEEFSETYIKAMKIISIFAIVTFFFQIMAPNIIEMFPTIKTTKWVGEESVNKIHNLFIGVANVQANYKRNCGIFYEPGLLALYTNLAIFLLMFKSKKLNIKTFILLNIAVITSFSTNGYISLILMYVAYFMKKRNPVKEKRYFEKKYRNYVLGIVMLLAIFTKIFFTNNPKSWNFLTNKLFELNGTVTSGSGYERRRAIELAFDAIYQNPITGLSTDGQAKFFNGAISTFTPLQWFITYGFIFGFICNICLVCFTIEKKENIFCSMLKLVAFMSMIVSQNMSANIFIIAIIIYQACNYIRGRKYDNSNSSNIQY